jgi:hypothetical protein
MIMIKLFASVCIDAPAAAVWEKLARLEDIQLWSDVIRHATCEGDLSCGVGAERTCELVGNLTIKERWVAWDEGRSFKYEGSGIPLVKHASNLYSVRSEGAQQSLLTTEAEVELKGGIFGKLLEPIMAVILRRMAPNSLAAFKYLVENGRPYAGKHSELPRIPATC